MSRTCTVCVHAERAAIDAAIVAGEPNRCIASQFGLVETSIRRHAEHHLPIRLVQAAEQEDRRQAIDVLAQLRAINAASLEVLRQARTAGDGELVLRAVDRVVRQIELQAKLLGDLQQEGTVNLAISPEWTLVRAAIFEALQPHPDARVAVSTRLLELEAARVAGG